MSLSPPPVQRSPETNGTPPPLGNISSSPFRQIGKHQQEAHGPPIFKETNEDLSVVVHQLRVREAVLEHELHQMIMSKEAADFRISHLNDVVPGLSEQVLQAQDHQQERQTPEETKTSGPELTQQLMEAMQGKASSDALAASLNLNLDEACQELKKAKEDCAKLRSEAQKKFDEAQVLELKVAGLNLVMKGHKSQTQQMKAKEKTLTQEIQKLRDGALQARIEQQKLLEERDRLKAEKLEMEKDKKLEAEKYKNLEAQPAMPKEVEGPIKAMGTAFKDKEEIPDASREEQLNLQSELQCCKERCDLAEQKVQEQEEMIKSQRRQLEEAKQRVSSTMNLASDDTVVLKEEDEEEECHPLDRAKRLELEIEEREMELTDLLQSRLQRLRLPQSPSTPLRQSLISHRSPSKQ